MKTLTIREVRTALARLDQILAREGEISITKHGRPIARLLPARPTLLMPSNAALRTSIPKLEFSSEVLIREDRDAR